MRPPGGVKNNVKSDIKAAKKLWIPWWGVLCLIIGGVPIVWLFDHFGKLDLALPILNGIGVFGFVLVLKWKERWYAWFWITMTIIAALHLLLFIFVPWTSKWVPAAAIAGIASLDFLVILTILSVVRKFAEKPKTSET